MSLILHNHHPSLTIYSNIQSNKFNFTTTQFRAQISHRRTNSKLIRFTAVKSASVNGYSVRNHDDDVAVDDVSTVGVTDKLLSFLRLIPVVLPGGKWWRFDDDVEIVQNAKPITLVKALRRMWRLISSDRWIIFAAFSALILTAVLIYLFSFYFRIYRVLELQMIGCIAFSESQNRTLKCLDTSAF